MATATAIWQQRQQRRYGDGDGEGEGKGRGRSVKLGLRVRRGCGTAGLQVIGDSTQENKEMGLDFDEARHGCFYTSLGNKTCILQSRG